MSNPLGVGVAIAGVALQTVNVGISAWTLVEVRGMRKELQQGLAQLEHAITAQCSAIERVQQTLDDSLVGQLVCKIRTIEDLACMVLMQIPAHIESNRRLLAR